MLFLGSVCFHSLFLQQNFIQIKMSKSYLLSIKYGAAIGLLYCVYKIAAYYISIPTFASMPMMLIEIVLFYPLAIFFAARSVSKQSTQNWSFVFAFKNIFLVMLAFTVVLGVLPIYFGTLDIYPITRPYFVEEINRWYETFDLPEERRLAEIAKLDKKHTLSEKIVNHFSGFMIGKAVLLFLFSLILKNTKNKF